MHKDKIYSDGIHIVSLESVKHLHEYCHSINLHRCWFHNGTFPHYDIPVRQRETFLSHHPEVKQVTAREIVLLMRQHGKAKKKP